MEIRNKQTAYKQAFNEKAYDAWLSLSPRVRKRPYRPPQSGKANPSTAIQTRALLARMGLAAWPEAKEE